MIGLHYNTMTDLHYILRGLGVEAEVNTRSRSSTDTSLYVHVAVTNHWLVPVKLVVLEFRDDIENDFYIVRDEVEFDSVGLFREDIQELSVYSYENYADADSVVSHLQEHRATIALRLISS